MKLLKKVLQRGLLDTLQTGFERLVPASICRWSYGVIYELDGVQIATGSYDEPVTDASFQWIVERVNDCEAKRRLREVTHNSAPLEYSQNDVGYAVIHSDTRETAGGVWVGVDEFLEADLGFKMRFANDQAWIYCAHISKAYRNKGAYGKLLSYAIANLEATGRKQFFAMVVPWNRASTKIHSRRSKRLVGRVKVVRVFSRVWLSTNGQISTDKCWFNVKRGGPAEIKIA